MAGKRSDTLTLADTEIHVWQVSLVVSSDEYESLAKTLSVDEQARANRFRFSRDAHRFVASRGLLRILLGQYVHLNPAQIQFCYSDRGKPSLANSRTAAGLVFNLSHSEDFMVCAIARNCCVGIDLECVRPVANLEDLTQRFFSTQEHAAIHALSEESRLRSFFQHWTCKEALLKATGEGLTSLSAIEVCITNNAVRLVSWNNAERVANSWLLELFTPTPAYVAAIAADSKGRSLVFLHWDAK